MYLSLSRGGCVTSAGVVVYKPFFDDDGLGSWRGVRVLPLRASAAAGKPRCQEDFVSRDDAEDACFAFPQMWASAASRAVARAAELAAAAAQDDAARENIGAAAGGEAMREASAPAESAKILSDLAAAEARLRVIASPPPFVFGAASDLRAAAPPFVFGAPAGAGASAAMRPLDGGDADVQEARAAYRAAAALAADAIGASNRAVTAAAAFGDAVAAAATARSGAIQAAGSAPWAFSAK